MNITEEDKFRNKVYLFFRKKLKESKLRNSVEVLQKIQVLKDITLINDKVRFMRKNTRWSLIMGFQNQDIVFASTTYIPRYRFEKSDIIDFSRCPDKIVIPLAICELKIGSSLNTHQLLVYSQIAQEIKYLHPFCKYYLIVNLGRNFFGETLARQTKKFDAVFLNWKKDKNEIWDEIKGHLNYLRKQNLI